jgi:transposase InsO family protein
VSRFRFIQAEKACYPIALLCRALQVSRAGYYAWAGRGVSMRAQADAALTQQIRTIHQNSRGTYGAPRVHAELQSSGQQVSRKRVARLMQAAAVRGCSRRRQRVCTTVTDPTATAAPNLVARSFEASRPNELWVGDITYLPTDEGWLYLATLLDAYSRRIVGWAMAEHLRTELALDALTMALQRRRPPPGQLVQHTDRGCQYTAHAYQAVLAAHGVTCSMSRAGDCYDNALAESFFGTLKAELVHGQHWPSRRAARLAVFEWIEVFYNRQRRHSALAFLSPVEFETSRIATLVA